MMPFLPLGRRVAGPYLFLLALGGVMALAEFWLWCQLPRRPAVHRRPRTARDVRRALLARGNGSWRASISRTA